MLGNGTHWWFFFKRVNPSFNKLHYEKVSLEKDLEKKHHHRNHHGAGCWGGRNTLLAKSERRVVQAERSIFKHPEAEGRKRGPQSSQLECGQQSMGIAHEEGQQRVDHQGPRRPSTVCGFILREVGDAWKFWAPGCMTGSAFGNRSLCLNFRDYFSRDKREHPSLSHNNCSYGGWWKWC